jgi:hypothetical protein
VHDLAGPVRFAHPVEGYRGHSFGFGSL